MTEGKLLKLFIEKEHPDKNALLQALNMSEDSFQELTEHQTIEPEMKKKLSDYLHRNIFDGTLLMEEGGKPSNLAKEEDNN